MPVRPSSNAALALALLLVLGACPSPRDDRHALLEAIDRVHDAVTAGASDARASRDAARALAQLRVRDELVPTRDRCAELYGALADHAAFAEEATALLDRYERVPPAEVPPDVATRVRAAVTAAADATEKATRARPECERMRATLRRELSPAGG